MSKLTKVVKSLHKIPIAKPSIGVSGRTGTWRWMKPVVDLSKCTKCYQCEIYCPDNSILVEVLKGAIVNYEYCKGCGVCAEVCPVKAINMVEEEHYGS